MARRSLKVYMLLLVIICIAGAITGGMIHLLVTMVPSPYNYIIGGIWIVLFNLN